MAFHDNISHQMALQHYADQQQLTENVEVLRGILPSDHHHQHHHLGQSSSSPDAGPKTSQSPPPTWLNSAILRQHNHHYGGDGSGGSFLHLQTTNSDSSNSNNHWLSPRPIDNDDSNRESMFVSTINSENNLDENAMKLSQRQSESDGNGNGNGNGGNHERDWEFAKCKADILSHPMYDQLLSAHVSCLRIATPVDQLPRIDAQLAQSQQVIAKYSVFGNHNQPLDDKDLNQFMAHYVVLLSSFKEQLQQHVRVHAMEAVMACWELEQSLQSLTGVAPGEGTGATMSDDDEEQVDSDTNMFDGGLDVSDSMGFGLPTESERSLMERVRQELKHELKQGYKEKIVDIREEILRKRRAGKLPGDTTSLLKAWWQSHSKWPYPTEEDKARLVQETGLQLKQINNWFINQRKRNWHSNPSSSTAVKTKRKR
ncbi:homeobox protein knotted-1-like LET12 isoform X2 [Lactuca sativa]|uniref:homeobox protein knotted-1-like LET12 isoform X2 n=1 Tax=Lactuca sativa TaxID=4236 RepID=UPI000CD8611A|nr:homeobox protein knotted-1-like LET12 isoform X2 [Lactuca sativa]